MIGYAKTLFLFVIFFRIDLYQKTLVWEKGVFSMNDKMPMNSFINHRRTKLGLSQREFARQIFCSPQVVSRFEKEDPDFPLDVLPRICDSLHYAPSDVFERETRHVSKKRNAPIDPKLIATNIKVIRLNLGLTQIEFSECFKRCRRTIRNYEKGISMPTFRFAEELLSIYPISPDEFLYSPITPRTSRKNG